MKHNARLRARLWEEADGHCIYCGHPVSPEEMEADHIFPRSMGGADQYGNMVCCCHACNSRKANTPLEEYLIDSMSESKLRKYKNRLDTLVRQGRLSEDKADKLYPVMWPEDGYENFEEEEDSLDFLPPIPRFRGFIPVWIPVLAGY